MRRSANRRAAASAGGNRRMLAAGAVIAAVGAAVAFTTISNAATVGRKQGSDAGKVVNGQTILTDNCVDSQLQPHSGFQDGNRCVSTAFGEVGVAANNPTLLITQAPKVVAVNTPFTLKISTRNIIRDRFLAAGAGGYYVESSVLKNGLERGHFHTACRMLANTNEAPAPDPTPAFFVATEDTKGGAAPDTVTIQVPGLPTAGTAQCVSWGGDGSHRIPMMQKANQIPMLDAVRITVRDGGGNNGTGNNGGGNNGGGNNGGNNGGNTGNNGGATGNGGNTGNNGGGNNGGGNNGGNAGGNNTGGGKGNTGSGNGATTPSTQAPSQGGKNGGTGNTTGPTTKDDFTPNVTLPTTKATTKPATSHPAKSTNSGSGKADNSSAGDDSTRATSGGTGSAGDDAPSVTTKAAKPQTSSSADAGNYTYSNDDGVPNSGAKPGDLKLPAADPPATGKKSGPLALTGSNTVVFIGGGAVLLLVGLVVMAMTRRRRPSGNWQQ